MQNQNHKELSGYSWGRQGAWRSSVIKSWLWRKADRTRTKTWPWVQLAVWPWERGEITSLHVCFCICKITYFKESLWGLHEIKHVKHSAHIRYSINDSYEKNARRHQFTSVKVSSKRQERQMLAWMWRKVNFCELLVRMSIGSPPWKEVWRFLKKLK